MAVRSSEWILGFLERKDAYELVQRGCATPDHVIRTKPMALLVPSADHEDPKALAARIEREISEYARHYDRYFEEMCAKKNVTRTKLDPWPRIILVPRVGILAVGKTKKDAEIAADIYEHTIQVITDAEDVGAVLAGEPRRPLRRRVLEPRASEDQEGARAPLAKQIALVTGAASGIGSATTALFMELGAHVVACDRNGHALDAMASEIGGKRRQQLVTCVTDVTKRDQVGRAFTLAARMFGGVDIVVSNAGDAPEGRLDSPEGEEALRRSLDTNLLLTIRSPHRGGDDATRAARWLLALQREQERLQSRAGLRALCGREGRARRAHAPVRRQPRSLRDPRQRGECRSDPNRDLRGRCPRVTCCCTRPVGRRLLSLESARRAKSPLTT